MARAERQHARNATALLAPHGLHHREFRLLALLGVNPTCSINELADLAVLERPAVSKMLDRLQEQGWVRRVEDPADRRRWTLALTPAGQAKLDVAVPVVEGLFQRYQAGMSARAQAETLRVVRDFHRRVQAAAIEPSEAEPPCSADSRTTRNRKP
jgi:MarR family transcriptional regulator, organic hydroperoxide resistance regulator